jgi:hypothetical protein
MESSLKVKKNYLTFRPEIEYRLQVPVPDNKEVPAKLAWNLLHKTLPRGVRSGGIITDLKGMSANNILRTGLPSLKMEMDDILFHIDGAVTSAEDEKEESNYQIKTDFLSFEGRRHIQYKANISSEGRLADFIMKPVYEFDKECEIERLYMALEFFEPNLFWLIGLSPKITKACLIQYQDNIIYISFKAEVKNASADFFTQFGELAESMSALILEIVGIDLKADIKKGRQN